MPKLSLTERLSAALENVRPSISVAAADEIEDMIVEVATLELGPERAQTWASGKPIHDHGQNVLPLAMPLPAGASVTTAVGADGVRRVTRASSIPTRTGTVDRRARLPYGE